MSAHGMMSVLDAWAASVPPGGEGVLRRPGAIQPRGVMLVADASGTITHVAGEAERLFGVSPEALFGKALAALGIAVAPPAEVAGAHAPHVYDSMVSLAGHGGMPLAGSVHACEGRLIVELEELAALAPDRQQPAMAISRLEAALQQARTEQDLAARLAAWFREISGYERAMVYRFERNWDAHVVGESQCTGTGRFLGLHFPASDIPPAARAVYESLALRMIVDVEDEPAPLLAAEEGAGPLDMGLAILRIAPLSQRLYLRAMGTRALLVATLRQGAKLWGLLIAHHYAGPRQPGMATRQAAQLGSIVAMRHIARIEADVAVERRRALARAIDAISADAGDAARLADAVLAAAPALRAAVEFDGLAVRCGQETRAAGLLEGVALAPLESAREPVIEERFPDPILARLAASDVPPPVVGGAVLPLGSGDWLVLGRPERRRTVFWAGDPSAAGLRHSLRGDDAGQGFDAWREQVEGRAEPLGELECELVALLHTRLSAIAAHARERGIQHRLQHMQRLGAIGQVAGGVAHDLNNVLGVIGLNLELAQDEEMAADARRMIGQALEAVQQGRQVTSSLLAFARQTPLIRRRVAPAAIAEATVAMMSRVAGPRYAFALDNDETTPALTVDAAMLQTAVMNIVLNARDAMPEGGTVRISLRPATLGGQEAAAITVADTGTGMDEATLRRAVEPFFTTKDFGRGTGLGLAMVKGFAEQSGGTLEIESSPGGGTTVTILLPASDGADDAGPAQPPAPAPARAKGRVLVVEDNVSLQGPIRHRLEQLGFGCSFATSAAEARERLEGRDIPIVLTDIQLPGGETGLDIARWAAEALPGTRVALMTGYADAALIAEAAELGLPVLTKPFSMRELTELVIALGDGSARG